MNLNYCFLGMAPRMIHFGEWWIQENQKYQNQIRVMTKKTGNTTTWFVYILRCADDSLYTGITTDLTRRCEQHNAGTASRYTRSRLPVSMMYHEVQATRSIALKRELEIKAMSRKVKEELIKTVKRDF